MTVTSTSLLDSGQRDTNRKGSGRLNFRSFLLKYGFWSTATDALQEGAVPVRENSQSRGRR